MFLHPVVISYANKLYIFLFFLFDTFDYKLAGDIKNRIESVFFFYSKLACMPGEHTMFGSEKLN